MAENFVRDGRVGDEVWHPCFGNGEIHCISHDGDLIFPVHVFFRSNVVWFTSTGRLRFLDKYASLCWGHRISQQINQGKSPVRENSDG